MNSSLLSADRTTHLKIVVIALVSAIVVVIVGINARPTDTATAAAQTRSMIVKAGQPTTFATQDGRTVR